MDAPPRCLRPLVLATMAALLAAPLAAGMMSYVSLDVLHSPCSTLPPVERAACEAKRSADRVCATDAPGYAVAALCGPVAAGVASQEGHTWAVACFWATVARDCVWVHHEGGCVRLERGWPPSVLVPVCGLP